MTQSADTLALLAELIRLYRLCLDMTSRAVTAEAWSDEAQIEEFLRRRAEVFTRVIDTEKGLNIGKEEGRPYRSAVSEAGRPEVERALDELEAVISALIQADEHLRAGVESRLSQLGDELRRLRQGHLALKAYSPRRTRLPGLINKRN